MNQHNVIFEWSIQSVFCWRSNMTRRVGIPLNGLTPTTFLYLSQARTGFPTSHVVVFNYMMWEVIVDHHCLEVIVDHHCLEVIVDHHCLEKIVCFVDIGGIDDHHCLEVIVCFVDIGRIVDHHCLEAIVLLILIKLLTITV